MESKADILSRVCLMAENSETWDLSDNDTRALRHVLAERNEFKQSSELSALRIRELEAEIAVRDNSANEVLRILREATGERDFHSEMEAAEWAAKMLAEARRDSARLDGLEKKHSVTDIFGRPAFQCREITYLIICGLWWGGYILWRIHSKLAEIEWLITDTRAEVRGNREKG